MANNQPLMQGGSNIASLPTTIAMPTVAGGSNRQAFNAFGPPAGIGLFGTASPLGPNLLADDTGVVGTAQTTGVFGRAAGGILSDDNGNIILASAGVAGVCGPNGVGVHGSSSAGFGVLGQDKSGVGVQGASDSGAGVVGQSTNGVGVTGSGWIGVAGTSQSAQGVFGTSVSSAGVAGKSTTGSGVHGRSSSGIGVVGDSAGSIGVYGSATSQPGVRGDSNTNHGVMGMSIKGSGVMGWSTDNVGVYGYSPKFYALQGVSVSGVGLRAESATGVGVLGWQTANVQGAAAGVVGVAETGFGVMAFSRAGISLYAKSVSSLAARFDGDVEIHGSFNVIGGSKSAVVPHRDGTHRQLYCVESPESWFEDFGETSLKNGVAKVKLDRDFAALVNTRKYQVFLSSYDRAQLYVQKRTRDGFEIRAIADAGGRIPKMARCAYRIVARRKDIKAPRLAKVKLSAPPKQFSLPKLQKSKAGVPPKKIQVKLVSPKQLKAKRIPPVPKVPRIVLPEISS